MLLHTVHGMFICNMNTGYQIFDPRS